MFARASPADYRVDDPPLYLYISFLKKKEKCVFVLTYMLRAIAWNLEALLRPSTLCFRPCVSVMIASGVAAIASIVVGGGEVQVAEQVADVSPKRRRLSAKGPCAALPPPPPPPPPPVLPVLPEPIPLWNDADEASFEAVSHRRRYRVIYNKFQNWWFREEPVWVSIDDCPCTQELWNLGRQDYGALSKQQKNLLMRFFA